MGCYDELMHGWQLALLFGSGFIAGVVNSIAGGGALLIYPLLLSLGVAPISANATTTITVWPGALSSAYGYKKYIHKIPKYYFWLLVPCVLGGLLGAFILRKTSNHTFEFIVPWFIIFGVVMLALQPRIHKWLYTRNASKTKKRKALLLPVIAVTLLIFATYGGYFGAGFGILMLALLGLTELSDIRQMNGLKNLSAVSINLVASVYFVIYHLVDWRVFPLLLIGSIVGGWLGATYSSKLPANIIRKAIIVIGVVVAIVLFAKL